MDGNTGPHPSPKALASGATSIETVSPDEQAGTLEHRLSLGCLQTVLLLEDRVGNGEWVVRLRRAQAAFDLFHCSC